MTSQEKRIITEQYVRLIRENMHLLREREGIGRYRMRGRLRILMKWLEVINGVYRQLRRSEGKSGAKARHDQLIARTIELMVYEEGSGILSTRLTGRRRVLSKQYVDRMADEAFREIAQAAEQAGLLGGCGRMR